MKKKNLLEKTFLWIPLFILIAISLINMREAGKISSVYQNHFWKQAIWFSLGFLIMFIIKIIKAETLFKGSKILYIINVILLILVLFIGKEINGSRAWFNFKFFSFQPSELMKFTLALYLCEEVSKMPHKTGKDEVKMILKSLFITIIPSLFVFLEPDTGAILIYFMIFLGIVIAFKINKKWYFILGTFLILFGLLFTYLYCFQKDLLIKLIGTSFFYRIDRLLTFVNKDSFQLDRALITIGNAGLFKSNASVYIPEAPTDFIIAFSIGNFGVISFILIILSLLLLDIYFLKLVFKTKNKKYKLFASAFLFMFIFAQIENIGMNLGLLPIIGLPLPFVSYGGTNIMVYFMFLGILTNIKSIK